MTTILVYKYGLLRPNAEDRALIEREMRAGHFLQNEFIAITRAEREALRAIQIEINPQVAVHREELALMDKAIQDGCSIIKSARAKTRTRETDADMANTVAELRKNRKAAVKRFQNLISEVQKDPRYIAARDVISERRKALWNSANTRGTDYGWRTSGSKARAVQQAAKMPMYYMHEPNDPWKKRWSGEGQIGGQVAGGATLADIDTNPGIRMRLRDHAEIEVVSEEKRHGAGDSGRRHALSTLSLPIGKHKNHAWVSWPMIYHRPIPKDATITNATVNLRRYGRKEHWTVQLTLTLPSARCAPVNGGVVAVDLGWKKERSPLIPGAEGWVRLASWCGDDGQRGHLWLDNVATEKHPNGEIGGLMKAKDLRSIRDKKFDVARGQLMAWVSTLNSCPAWMEDAKPFMADWKSHYRLRSLCERWKNDRFDGDESAFGALEAWRYNDVHLEDWEANQRKTSLLMRQDKMRVLAAQLASRYSTSVFAAVDYSVLARRAEDEEDGDNEHSKFMRFLAAPGEARRIIGDAFKSRGGSVIEYDAQNMTTDCHLCGHRNPRPDRSTSSICVGCGQSRDVDHNLALNLLRAFREKRSAAKKPRAARKPEKVLNPDGTEEKPRQRVARLAKEKKARMEAARKADPMAAE